MKITTVFLFASLFFFGVVNAQTDSVRPAKEFVARGGLPNFFNRIKKQQPVTVAYLGGSITRADNGWRDQSFSWLRQQYPNTSFQQVMAAIGGTGSDFGACRLYEHVLKYKPNLVFIEFSVNDHSRTFQDIRESVEGIIRQIWKANRNTDICFVYTLFKGNINGYQEGKSSVAASAMESLADYYSIPSINVALPIAKTIGEGKMLLQGKSAEEEGKMVFAPDGVHPFSETGHKLYTACIVQHLKSMDEKSRKLAHSLLVPLEKNNWEDAAMMDISGKRIKLSAGWQVTDSLTKGKEFSRFVPFVYSSASPGDSISFKFKGRYFGLADIVGPSSGRFIVQVDNEAEKSIDRFDAYCTYCRLNYFFIKGLEDKEHRVVIKNSPERLDKEKILATRNAKMDNKARYEKQIGYLAYILLDKD